MKPFREIWLGLLLLATATSAAGALETFPAADPRSVVQTVIALTDRHALPSWDQPSFPSKLAPYLTADFIHVVKRGGDIAVRKHINLYDAEFFTGSQQVEHAKLFGATVTSQSAGAAVVEAVIGVSDDPKKEPASGDTTRFELKREAGAWKIDDFKNLAPWAKDFPSVKTTFGDPVKYGQ